MANVDLWRKVEHFYSRKRFYFFVLASYLLGIAGCAPKPQDVPLNEYGLKVIGKEHTYRLLAASDSTQQLVLLEHWLHPVNTHFYYATNNNFTHKVLYKKPAACLRADAAKALKKVQDSLHTLGLDIKIFDAYRPYAVTREMWKIVPDDRYAANPANGSGHNRGIAVDLTLVDTKTGKELEMPTLFDNFSDTAHHDFMQLSPPVLRNRALLRNVMEQFGFRALSTEWWHYSLPDPKHYELLDLKFNKIRRLLN